MIHLIVFDLDGTLVDSRRDLADATNALVAELGGSPLPELVIGEMVGNGAAVLVKRALAGTGLDPDTPGALSRFLHHYDARLLATTRPYPGIFETIQLLGATRRLAVLTNKPAHATMRVLDGLGLLPFFDDVIGGDTAHGRKPDPTGLLALVSRAGVTPEATLLVGDSPIDLATARAAGTHICLARYGFGYRFEGDGLHGNGPFIDEPAALPAVVNALV